MKTKVSDADRKSLGKGGERIACDLLEEKGYVVLARNFRVAHKEIDIICADGADLRFVEVKTRREPVEGAPWEAVNEAKQRNIAFAARHYLLSAEFRALNFVQNECHFDVLTIVWDKNGRTYVAEHFPDAYYILN